MRTTALAVLLAAAACATGPGGAAPRAGREPDPRAAPSPPPLVELRELLVVSGGDVSVAPHVLALAGARVRVRGWHVAFEEPLADGFWLAPRPIVQDESGAGTGDLPPRSVRVRAPEAVVRALPPDPAPLEAAGRLEVGREVDPEGRVSIVRVVVEDPRDVLRLAATR